MSLLATAETPARPADAPTYEEIRASKIDPDAPGTAYAVDRRVTDGALFLRVTKERKDKDASVKRIALAPVARALTLEVID